MKPYRGTTFFADGLSSRQPIEGTVARGYLRSDTEYFTGKKAKAPGASASATPATQQTAGAQAPGAQTNSFPDDVDTFPFPVTREVVDRGHQRYNVFCSACHGLTGNGDGMIVRRGFPSPPSYHTDRLRNAPDAHFYSVITNGYGMMYSYADRVAPHDRWAIVAYIRALQLSQDARIGDVPPERRAELAKGSK